MLRYWSAGCNARQDSALDGVKALLDLAEPHFDGTQPVVHAPHIVAQIVDAGIHAGESTGQNRDHDGDHGEARADDGQDEGTSVTQLQRITGSRPGCTPLLYAGCRSFAQ